MGDKLKTGPFQKALLLVWAAFQIWEVTFGSMDAVTFRAVHCLFLLVFAFTLTETKNRLFRILLVSAAVLSAGIFGWFAYAYRSFALSGGYPGTVHVVVAGVAIALVFAAGFLRSRSLAVLAAIFFAYNFFGAFLPGALGHGGFTLRRVLTHLFWGSNGIFGVGVGVSSTYIFMFVLFGALLQRFGFSSFLNDLALALVGGTTGGVAKISVFSSAFFGMINGSAVANVATDGCMTIPLMKKAGYKPEYAAAVEAAASTGGQFTPPVMGAVGFVMAEFLGVSYPKVMLAAIAPAFLYYLSLFFSVHFEAKRLGLHGLSKDNLPEAKAVLKQNWWLLIPVAVLVAVMAFGYTPLYACTAAIVALFAVCAVKRKESGLTLKTAAEAVMAGAADSVSVGVCCILIGIIIGTVSLTGAGLTLGNLILSLAGEGKAMLCAVLVMLLCCILGMGVPGVAAYVIVSTISVPALMEAGASAMAAHMFCLIYACLANITPPVAVSCYVAAGIAKSNQWRTGLCAVKIAAAGFLFPFFFVYNDALLIGSAGIPAWETALGFLTASCGVICLAAAFEGMLYRRCTLPERLALIVAALCCMAAEHISDLAGILIFAGVLAYQYFREAKNPRRNAET
ncbi:MAG TPA: TRAP transporter fused permease subunit [Oscillospiraceae bacterium]|nr:TRAP transporter fused permease subunit [Oscillospiraceae bacterium]